MNAAPRVTVVTTTYNYPSALKLAMETVLDQSFGDFEYLVIGDGCTDETEQVVLGFNDPRIRWHNLPENLGNQSDVNRVALEMARGELVAYLNHDDLWFPDHLELLVDCIDDGGFDIASSLCITIAPPPNPHRGVVGLVFLKPGADAARIASMTSSVVHTAEISRAAGGWKKWRELDGVPTLEFFARIRAASGNHAVVPRVTCLKFHSALRRDSYRLKDANEQELWLERMRSDPGVRHNELATAMAMRAARINGPKLHSPKKPPDAEPGWQIAQLRKARGLAPMVDIGESEADAASPFDVELDEAAPVKVGPAGQVWIKSTATPLPAPEEEAPPEKAPETLREEARPKRGFRWSKLFGRNKTN